MKADSDKSQPIKRFFLVFGSVNYTKTCLCGIFGLPKALRIFAFIDSLTSIISMYILFEECTVKQTHPVISGLRFIALIVELLFGPYAVHAMLYGGRASVTMIKQLYYWKIVHVIAIVLIVCDEMYLDPITAEKNHNERLSRMFGNDTWRKQEELSLFWFEECNIIGSFFEAYMAYIYFSYVNMTCRKQAKEKIVAEAVTATATVANQVPEEFIRRLPA